MKSVTLREIALVGATSAELTAAVVAAIDERDRLGVSFVNPHSFNLLRAGRARDLGGDLAQLVVAVDGIGVVWAARVLLGVRLNRVSFDLWAPDLLPALRARRERVFLLGGQHGVAAAAAAVLRDQYPGLDIVGTSDGYAATADLERLARTITDAGASVVVVGAGAPRQERLAVELLARVAPLVVVTCGGFLDQVIRPGAYYPSWAYPLRLNWVVRLWREPRRLWRRYLLGNPRFVVDTLMWYARHPRRS
jgi:exopolysaccharide biosynthesis WecB/TagA/CpsF family protein